MKPIEKIVIMWGIFDLGTIVHYVGYNFYKKQIPFYHDIKSAQAMSYSLGMPSMKYLAIIGIMVYLTLIISGIQLIRRKKMGSSLIEHVLAVVIFRHATVLPNDP